MTPETQMDVLNTAPPSGAAPSGDALSSEGTQGQASSSADVITQPGTQEVVSPTAPEYFKDIPDAEELRKQADQKVPYAAGLLNLRTALETLQPQHDQLQQQYTPWASVIEKYEKPENFQSAYETGRGLFSDTGEMDGNGLPIRTAFPGLQKLAQTNEADFLQLMNDGLHGFTYQGKPLIHHELQKLGLNPENIEQYKQWEREGFTPQTGYSEPQQEALATVPEKLKAAFDKAPPLVKTDLLNMDEETRNYHLEREQRELDRQSAEQTSRQQERERFEQGIQQASWGEREQSFQSSYGQLIEDLKPWQPTGNTAIDSLYHNAVGQLLTNVFDPTMSFSVLPVLKEIAPDIDALALQKAAEKWDEQRNLAHRYEAFGKQGRYQMEATEARNATDKTFRSLKASMSDLAKRVVEYLTKDRAEVDAAELAAQGQQGRPRINGAPNGNQPPPNQGYNTDWRKSFM